MNGNELLEDFEGLVLPSFDIAGGNFDIAYAIGAVAERCARGAFLASTPSSIRLYHGNEYFVSTVAEVSRLTGARVVAHLDHAQSLDDVSDALEAGFGSVMFDGSQLPFNENREASREAVAMGRRFGASVEVELGVVGGKEDEVEGELALPTLDECRQFVAYVSTRSVRPCRGDGTRRICGQTRDRLAPG